MTSAFSNYQHYLQNMQDDSDMPQPTRETVKILSQKLQELQAKLDQATQREAAAHHLEMTRRVDEAAEVQELKNKLRTLNDHSSEREMHYRQLESSYQKRLQDMEVELEFEREQNKSLMKRLEECGSDNKHLLEEILRDVKEEKLLLSQQKALAAMR